MRGVGPKESWSLEHPRRYRSGAKDSFNVSRGQIINSGLILRVHVYPRIEFSFAGTHVQPWNANDRDSALTPGEVEAVTR